MDGVIIINKPKGYTSHDIVNKMRKILNTKKVGHTGTLDPNATGVLPILIGNATKISKYLIEHNKTYIATIKLGEQTNTGDVEGEKIREKAIDKKLLTKENVTEVLESFLGKTEQLPPMYSAVKIRGKKLYDYARQGVEVERESREIEIYEITLLELDTKKEEIIFQVSCSKGTYIRVLCEDIAISLNTIGYMKELTRIKVDKFELKDSFTLEQIEESKEDLSKIEKEFIIPIETIFLNKNSIDLNNEKELELFINGTQLEINLLDEVYRIYYQKTFIGLGIIEANLLKRDVII